MLRFESLNVLSSHHLISLLLNYINTPTLQHSEHSKRTTPNTPTSLQRSITSDNNGHKIYIPVLQPSFIMIQSSEMSENQPATYVLDGACGRSKATLDGKKSAITVFNKHLHSLLLPEYEILVQDIRTGRKPVDVLCNVAMFQKFSVFLITVFQTSKDLPPKLSTILQYISGAVSKVHEDFPKIIPYSAT